MQNKIKKKKEIMRGIRLVFCLRIEVDVENRRSDF